VSLPRCGPEDVAETAKSVLGYYGGPFAALVLILAVAMSLARKGQSGMKMDLSVWMNGAAAVALAALLIFAWHMVRIPYQAYERQRLAIVDAQRENVQLKARLHTRRHYMEVNEPAFQNAWAVRMAFVQWDKALGGEPRTFLVTADRDSGPLMGSFIQYAVPAAGTGNGNVQNIGITPDDAERLEEMASVPGRLVFHARSDVKGSLQLYDALSVLVQFIERRYEMPQTPSRLPPNTIWLHFSNGTRWASEYWDEQRSIKATTP
jgi:hypothetical protein